MISGQHASHGCIEHMEYIRVSPHQCKSAMCWCESANVCSSTFAHSQICTWCPRTKCECANVRMCKVRRRLDLHCVEFGLCASTFALCALAMFGSQVWCSSTSHFRASTLHFWALRGHPIIWFCRWEAKLPQGTMPRKDDMNYDQKSS